MVTKISRLVRGSHIYWRGRSFAASVPSEISKVRKGQKRLPKDERKALVESFVSKYRSMNKGKFPTPSVAYKEVGGSYYVIRTILQELEDKSKNAPINRRNGEAFGKEVAKVDEASTDNADISNIQLRMDGGIHKDAEIVAGGDRDIGGSSEAVEKGQTRTLFEKTLNNMVVEPSPQDDCSGHVEKLRSMSKDEAEAVSAQCPEKQEHDVKGRLPSEGGLDLSGPNIKIEQHQQSPELGKIGSHLSEETCDDQKPQKKSSMWQNLKFLADGFINIWKKW